MRIFLPLSRPAGCRAHSAGQGTQHGPWTNQRVLAESSKCPPQAVTPPIHGGFSTTEENTENTQNSLALTPYCAFRNTGIFPPGNRILIHCPPDDAKCTSLNHSHKNHQLERQKCTGPKIIGFKSDGAQLRSESTDATPGKPGPKGPGTKGHGTKRPGFKASTLRCSVGSWQLTP